VFHKLIMKISERLVKEKQAHAKSDATDRIKDYIDRNIYEHLNIEIISRKIGLSTSQINRVFREAFETTPYEYILNRKIDTAKLLLRNTTLTVKEIAYKLNFADEHYFSNVFYKRTGVRPGKYQSGCKQDK